MHISSKGIKLEHEFITHTSSSLSTSFSCVAGTREKYDTNILLLFASEIAELQLLHLKLQTYTCKDLGKGRQIPEVR